MFALIYTFLYIDDVQKRVLAKPQRSSLRIHMGASERSERASCGVFNSFTVKKVNFFTINVKFKVILSSKSGGGGGKYLYRPSLTQATPPPGYTPMHCDNHLHRDLMGKYINQFRGKPIFYEIFGLYWDRRLTAMMGMTRAQKMQFNFLFCFRCFDSYNKLWSQTNVRDDSIRNYTR